MLPVEVAVSLQYYCECTATYCEPTVQFLNLQLFLTIYYKNFGEFTLTFYSEYLKISIVSKLILHMIRYDFLAIVLNWDQHFRFVRCAARLLNRRECRDPHPPYILDHTNLLQS